MNAIRHGEGYPDAGPTAQVCQHLATAAGTTEWLVLVAVRSSVLRTSLVATGLPVFLIEPNPALAARLVDRHEASATVTVCQGVPGSGEGQVLWHHYNDPRLDGVRPPEDLLQAHPNLRLQGTSFRASLSLEQLLEGWPHGPAARPGDGLLLVEDASLPAVLAGACSLLPRLRKVAWWLSGGGSEEGSAGLEIQAALPLPTPPSRFVPRSDPGDNRLLWYERAETSPAPPGGLEELRQENLALRRRLCQLQELVRQNEARLLLLESQRRSP